LEAERSKLMLPRIERRLNFIMCSAIVRELNTIQKYYQSTTDYTTQTLAGTKLHPFYVIERLGY